MSKGTTLLLLMTIVLGYFTYRSSYAFFSDSASATGNTFTAASIFPTPTPVPVNPGDVVINEINWSGSSLAGQDGQNDEWIELRNMTNHPIDISGWKISGAVSGDGDLPIPTATISANGFYLISNFDKGTSRINIDPDLVTTAIQLDNSNAQYILRDTVNTVIDTADDGSGNPLAGSNGNPKSSMERNNIPGDGTQTTSWHAATSSVNFDLGATELGTPRAMND